MYLPQSYIAKGVIYGGRDFSERMIAPAKEKMPDSKLFRGDFSNEENMFNLCFDYYGGCRDITNRLLPFKRR